MPTDSSDEETNKKVEEKTTLENGEIISTFDQLFRRYYFYTYENQIRAEDGKVF